MPTILDGSGELVPGRRPLDGTDLEIAYNLLGDELLVRVNKAGVHVFGVVLEKAHKAMIAEQLLEFKTGNSDLVVTTMPAQIRSETWVIGPDVWQASSSRQGVRR
jgi:hypothetical protein